MIKLSDLNIVSENTNEIIAFCPFHDDKKRPNLLVSKTGKFAGFYKCWACGAFGQIEGDFKVGELKDKPNPINWESLSDMYRQQINVQQQWELKKKWNVRWKVLEKMEIGWDSEAWTFSVRNEYLDIVGIQRIFLDNSKRMVNGSKIGVSVPFGLDWQGTIYITEGLHDLATILDLGFDGVGRLSATCGANIITNLITDFKTDIDNIIIIADNDEVGKNSAKKLTLRLTNLIKCGIIYCEVGKDISEMVEIKGKRYVKKWVEEKVQSL